MAPLEEGDDGYGVKYNSMFSRAVNGDANPSNATLSRFNDEVDDAGVSCQRRTAPFAPGVTKKTPDQEMTMAEIMCGKGDYFPGLISSSAFLDHINL
jgi:hypothetical protein